jgi:glycine hydroxymethyltransferase
MVPEDKRISSAIAFFAGIDHIAKDSGVVSDSIIKELKSQRSFIKLIASENYSSLSVQLAMSNLLTDKYSEGYSGHRFYAGCENVDTIESLGVDLAKKVFGADHAYIQPHSGADANLIAYWAVLIKKIENKEIQKLEKKNVNQLTDEEYENIRIIMNKQKVMGMSLNSGGHLTHGYRMNISSKMMRAVNYDVNPDSGLIDYLEIEKMAKKEKPLILIAGYSAYPRLINFSIMREIADSIGAVLLVDMAHFAGLVAGKALKDEFNPIPYAHIVTSTTHKTLRGPRGGFILCTKEFQETVDKGCPLVMGGPLPHVMAAKAIAFQEASSKDFEKYAKQIIINAKALAKSLIEEKVNVLTNGTDNHLILFNVLDSFGLSGKQAEMALRDAKITVNRNSIYNDKMGPWYASGVRIGTPAITTLGMKEEEMKIIGKCIAKILKNTKPQFVSGKKSKSEYTIDSKILEEVKSVIGELLSQFPLYPELVMDS